MGICSSLFVIFSVISIISQVMYCLIAFYYGNGILTLDVIKCQTLMANFAACILCIVNTIGLLHNLTIII